MRSVRLLLAPLLVVVGCASSEGLQERSAYVRANALSPKDSTYVLQQRIYEGMPAAHALAALGDPDRRDTTTAADGRPRVQYVYRARLTSFDPRSDGFDPAVVYEGIVSTENGRVVDWTGLHDIPQLRAYYRHKSGAQAIRIQNRKQ